MSTFSPAIREFIAAPDDARRLGAYRCKELLDTAGTAPVFKAVEEHAGVALREVAIKVFDIGAKAKRERDGWQDRVMREARALCRVQHPNVIRFHTLATDEKRGLMGLVMEFADGISLARSMTELPRGDARRVARAVEIGVDVASALAAAHDAGIVHCNIKPSNIVFTDGTHKLINFGIAASLASRGDGGTKEEDRPSSRALRSIPADAIGQKAAGLEKSSDESAAPIAGTIGYTDPVCIRTTAVPTTASDLYSLGATLYEVVAGHVPAHRGEGVDAKVLTGEAPATPLAEVAPFVSPQLARLVDALVSPTREARPRSADAVRRELEKIRSALTGHERALPPEERGPFPGLDRYEAADRDVFLGRSAEIAGALELARRRGLVALVGVSGSGKSSITRAGIIPAIEEGALGGWPATYRSVVVTPGSDLMAALDAALVKVVGAPLAKEAEAIVEQLRADVDAKSAGLVILIDQLEEIVLKHPKEDPARDRSRLDALALLSRLADANAGLRVIVAVRQDLLDEVLAVDASFGNALSRGIQHLGPLSATAWEEVVDQSLEAYGYTFEDASVRKDVLAELRGRATAMTLGQFGLSRLWAARDAKKKTIPRSAFADKGGMRAALAEHAAEAVASIDLPQETLRELLLKMTTPDGARAHVKLDSLTEAEKKALFALTKARLVVSENEGFTYVHDSVLRDWGLLHGWINDARDDRLLLAHLERDAKRWSESKDSAELWRKSRLAAARELWRRPTVTPSETAREFVTKSASEEGKVRVAFWTLASMLVMIVVGGSLVYAKESREHADALAAALAQVQQLKKEAEENAMEAAASAKLLHDMQKQAADERAAYGANVQAAVKKVTSATTLDGAQKASQELQAQAAAPSRTPAPVVPLPLNLLGSNSPNPQIDTSGPGPSAGSGAFDQGAIERVVAARKTGVKRTCLDRGANTASSTKITASLTIAPNGSVQSVSTSGDDPAIGKCIENQLKSWTFPAPGEVKQVQIPFVFVRQ